MSKDVRVRLDFKALASMTQDLISQRTLAAAARAGEGYVGDVVWTDRPHGAVRAETRKAREDNARNNTLLKAVYGL